MRKTRNLVRNSDAKVPTTIKLIDAEEVNAFALPGGSSSCTQGS
jgi:predicted Zn-dependent protease